MRLAGLLISPPARCWNHSLLAALSTGSDLELGVAQCIATFDLYIQVVARVIVVFGKKSCTLSDNLFCGADVH